MLIVLQISTSECSQDRLRQLLAAPTKTSRSLEPCYVAPSEFLHLCKCRKHWLWQLSLLQSLARSRKAFLLRPSDVEKNPGPAAAAAAETQSKKSKFQTVIHVNARSLLRYFDDLASLVSTERLHIIAISETWLDSSVSNNKIHLAGFNLFRIDRNRSGGGVAVYCSDHLPCSLLHCGTSSSGVASLWVSVRVPSLFSRFPAKFSRSMFISSFHNISTPTTCSTLFSLDSALPTQPKLFSSTALTNGIRPSTPRSMYVQCSLTFPKLLTLPATSFFYPNLPT